MATRASISLASFGTSAMSRFALDRPAELPHVLGVHAVEEVEIVDAVGGDPHIALGPRHAMPELRRHGENVRTATGPSHRGELV